MNPGGEISIAPGFPSGPAVGIFSAASCLLVCAEIWITDSVPRTRRCPSLEGFAKKACANTTQSPSSAFCAMSERSRTCSEDATK